MRARRKDFLRRLPEMRVDRVAQAHWSTALLVVAVLLGGTAVLAFLLELPEIVS